jgi:cysteine desulfurase
MRKTYLDNNATTPLHPEVKEAIAKSLDLFGNASSAHFFGQEAKKAVDDARKKVAALINAKPGEIIFTSCGSESNNLVIKGVTCQDILCKTEQSRPGKHLITSQIEHPSVMNPIKSLERQGFKVTWLPVDQYGLVDPALMEKAITNQTVLVSIMTANNEIGTIEPISELAQIARKHEVYFHTDAVQAVGKLDIDVKKMNVDFLSLSGHKLYAPKGVAAAYIREGITVCPLLQGGHQEKGLRGGTENNLGIIALGKACEVAMRDRQENVERIWKLREKLRKGILEKIPDVIINGHPEKVLPTTLSVTFRYIEGESILLRMSAEGIAVSTGSACASGSLEPSHVLLAIGLPHELAHGTIRFSLGIENSEEDIDYTLKVLPGVIQQLREMSPLWPDNKR